MNIVAYLLLVSILLFPSCSKKTIDFSAAQVNVKGSESLQDNDLLKRMKDYQVPGVSIALVEGGELKWTKGYGMANTLKGQKVDEQTLFQAASISKPLAALAVLKLMEEEKVDLDEDVNTYLKEWKVSENDYTKERKVTLRRLLTHTGGVGVHGFPGYRQTDILPSITQVLNGEGNTSAIFVNALPGRRWRYSGGGYTILEKVVEDVSGKPFETFMKEHILRPLGMENSTFQQPLPIHLQGNASAAYDRQGTIIEGLWHNYPEQAAAGLWTTPTDLAKYCIKMHQILSNKSSGVLSKQTLDKMLTKHLNGWGLGPALAQKRGSLILQHGGKNVGFTNHLLCYVQKGNALIIMTNGDNGGKLIGEIRRSIVRGYKW